MTLLHIDSSITGSESVSRKLTTDIVAHLTAQRPDLRVVYRDLAAQPVPHQTEALLIAKSGAGTPGTDLQAAITATDTALDDFLAAEIVVIGAPMYNFSVPSQLKAWIDALAVPGRTFAYGANGVEGLCGDKKLIVASSRGGIYSPPSPIAVLDHQETFLRGFFGFIGVTDISFVRAEGVRMGPEQKEQALAAARAETQALRAA
ncbi:FMN-dependent NADH-azoreductase [Flaviflagellibacter deserti]|uniref:FMN dependent NADH:quinone oxidoreductase n=1 Tax=Flaviflagellibacter deserti TaxID=2267266 RepID=A0ABV9YYZ8_9HYPH